MASVSCTYVVVLESVESACLGRRDRDIITRRVSFPNHQALTEYRQMTELSA